MFDKLKRRFGAGRSATPAPAGESPAPPPILDVTDADFEELVLRAQQPAVVDFWAEWCQPCQIVSAYIGFLAKEYEGRLVVAAIDTDENPETPAMFQVLGLPTILMVHNGKEVDRVVGVTSYEDLKQRVEQLLASLDKT